jgi:hypothetical protein
MYFLKNSELEVQIIDPVIDQKLLGSRYCTGGYIYQIKDLKKGNLLFGPQFSKPDFNVFDGQGAPEVFVTALNQESCKIGNDVHVIGVGAVTRTSKISPFHVRDNSKVKEFCTWEITEKKDSIEMTSTCYFNQWKFIITKIITLSYRTVASQTEIINNGNETIPILWFAHPFFPFPANQRACKFSEPIKLNENGGYFIDNDGFIKLRKEYDWKKGLYQKIVCNPTEKLSVIQCHSLVDKVSVTCDFIPDSIAIWANDVTFSFEPFYNVNIEYGEKRAWRISYCF